MNNIPIIYQDQDILVLNKPSGLVVDSSATQTTDTLEDILKRDFKMNKFFPAEIKLSRSGIVHRLDKDTSGLLVVAKTLTSLENLQSQFKNRTVKKEYLCLVHGLLDQSGEVVAAILRNPGNREKFTVATSGKQAQTDYQPENFYKMSKQKMTEIFAGFSKIQLRKLSQMNYQDFTLLKCLPKTGRTHQIRVHLKYILHPIVSDEKYGGRKTTRLDRRWCPRQFLHAARLEFNHPISGKRMAFECELPDDLKQTLSNLEQQS